MNYMDAFISSHYLSLTFPLYDLFTWLIPPEPYRATTRRERELNCGSQTYFFDHTETWRASPDVWSAQCRGHLRGNTNMKDDTNTFILTRRIWKDDYDGQMIFGDLVGLKLSDICLTGVEKPQKNLTQESCPDRESNPGPLHDRRACYRLFQSGGQTKTKRTGMS